ncbi:FAD-dependent monooxygenase [Bradyrhizobium prioriisuperbiae]|uniref:FAD-dependent monooxygenase n=1 Tax=Bradyrhizobium prioriisuperbiae TaxID=2854389 RepID=UPI0028E9817D|nr:FAD-dependent monooxygenase [Bradyrhizobium prioritasuperba]
MPRSRTILIAGAGIGGLTAALALASRGFRIVVLEKAERLEQAGAGLQLSPNASRILISLDVAPLLASRVIVPDAVHIMSARTGRQIGRIPLGAQAGARYGAPYWIVHRADLQAALLARIGDIADIELRLGTSVEDVVDSADGVTVTQRTGDSLLKETALALIGADGVWSTVRQQVFPKMQARFTGRIAWRGTVDAGRLPQDFNRHGVQLWLGPNAHLVAYPMSGGERINVVAISTGSWSAQGWDEAADTADIAQQFDLGRWPPAARSLVGTVDSWRRWALFAVDAEASWTNNSVALLGDAAHAMLPFVAQGAGMAIEDAAVLAESLADMTTPNEVPAALVRYSTQRRARVARMQRTARHTGQIYHLRGPLAVARDTVIRLLDGERLLSRQDWIYDWKADAS